MICLEKANEEITRRMAESRRRRWYDVGVVVASAASGLGEASAPQSYNKATAVAPMRRSPVVAPFGVSRASERGRTIFANSA